MAHESTSACKASLNIEIRADQRVAIVLDLKVVDLRSFLVEVVNDEQVVNDLHLD